MTSSDTGVITWALCMSIFQFTWIVHLQVGGWKFIAQVTQKNMLPLSGQPTNAYLITAGAKCKSNNSMFWIKRNFVDEHGCVSIILVGKYSHEWSLRTLGVHLPIFRTVGEDSPCQWEDCPGERHSLCSFTGHLAQDEKAFPPSVCYGFSKEKKKTLHPRFGAQYRTCLDIGHS